MLVIISPVFTVMCSCFISSFSQFHLYYNINNEFGWLSCGKKFSIHKIDEKIKIKTLGRPMPDLKLIQVIKKKTR